MSTSNNNSNILRKDISEMIDQIRKKAEDISTSEGSNRLFYNLSNPTNLTNPQIITLRKNDYLGNSEITKNSNTNYTNIRTRNIAQRCSREKNVDENTYSELHEHFLINKQIKKLVLSKKKKSLFNNSYKYSDSQSQNKDFFHLTNQTKLIRQFKKNQTMDVIGEEKGNFLNHFNEENKEKKEKEIRVNIRKHITARDYISRTKNIQLLKYIKKNRIEKLNMLVNMKNAEMDTLNNNIESFGNNRDLIITNYDKKYILYLGYLKRQKDKEQKKDIDLLIQQSNIRKENFQIQTKINKVQREKTLKLNLILLFIQIKERIKTLPENVSLFFGASSNNINNININDVNINDHEKLKGINKRPSLKRKITFNKIMETCMNTEDMKKIMQYKGKNIYNDVSEMEYDYNKMEEKVRKQLEIFENLKNDIKILRKKFKQVKEEMKNDPEKEKKHRFNYIFNGLLYKNQQLKSELKAIKIKYNIDTDMHTININKKRKLKQISSAINIFHFPKTIQNNTTNTGNDFFNNSLTNESNSIYNPKTILSFKNSFSIEKFDFNSASNLFYSCYNLYNTAKDNFFLEKDLQFDISIKRGSLLEIEKTTILKMIEYIDNVFNLLIKQKNMYLSNKHLRKKYEKIRDLIDKENRRKKLINDFKEDEEKKKQKLKHLDYNKDKVRFISTRKVDKKYFFKTQKEKITQAINLAQFRKAPTVEDFLFDVIN